MFYAFRCAIFHTKTNLFILLMLPFTESSIYFSHRELNVGLGCLEKSFYKEMILTFYRLAFLGPADKHKDTLLVIYYYTSQIIQHLGWGYNTVGRGLPRMHKALGPIPS